MAWRWTKFSSIHFPFPPVSFTDKGWSFRFFYARNKKYNRVTTRESCNFSIRYRKIRFSIFFKRVSFRRSSSCLGPLPQTRRENRFHGCPRALEKRCSLRIFPLPPSEAFPVLESSLSIAKIERSFTRKLANLVLWICPRFVFTFAWRKRVGHFLNTLYVCIEKKKRIFNRG